ncbi:MAG: hypothetical protein LBK58_00025 [Prevotellaceae bacterium]|jgi:hypothetical protein|nr:hypothetical protein [Prevotellaceae bacterium]
MKKMKLIYVWMCFIVLGTSVFSACKDDDEVMLATVEVTNNSDYTLRDLEVYHLNSDDELVRYDPLGDLAPGRSVTFTSESPKIYFVIWEDYEPFFSANYTLTAGKKTRIQLDNRTNWFEE